MVMMKLMLILPCDAVGWTLWSFSEFRHPNSDRAFTTQARAKLLVLHRGGVGGVVENRALLLLIIILLLLLLVLRHLVLRRRRLLLGDVVEH